MSNLRYLNTILTVLAVLLAAQLWTTWTGGASMSSEARAAGIPDQGAQNQQMIDLLKLLNGKTEEIKGILASGKLHVVTEITNEPKR
jgi:hypothetical protein